MKKIFTLSILAIFSIAISFAQPTLTSGVHMPAIGDSYTLTKAEVAASPITPVDGIDAYTGAGFSWDFSSLVAVEPITFSFVDPATTPDAGNYPTADFAVLVNNTNANYFSSDASSYSFIGNKQSFGESVDPAVVTYSDVAQYKQFPFTYNDNFVDNLAASYTILAALNRVGTITVTADGWGSLLLPGDQTVNDVIRIKKVEANTDTNVPLQTITSLVTSYEWYTADSKYPILVVGDTVIVLDGFVNDSLNNYGILYGEAPNNVNTVENSEINIFPNPSSKGEVVNIQLAEISDLEIYDQLGNQIIVKANVSSYNFNTAKLNAGLYFIRATANNNIRVKKIIIE